MNSSPHPRIDTALPAGLPVGMWFANRSRRGGREKSSPIRRLRAGTTGIGIVLVLGTLTTSADTTDAYFWEVIKGCKTITGTKNYLARYPQGKHAEEAYGCLERMREETAAWEQARSCQDKKSVMWYLERYPEGRYGDEARTCLETLAHPAPEPVQEPGSSQVEALLALCEQHFEANRLTTGVGGTAVECYLEVLAHDPSNLEAIDGLRQVFEKYGTWAQRALQNGDLAKARGYVDKMRGLVPEDPGVKELDEAIARSERQGKDEARIAEEEKAKHRADEARIVAEEEANRRADQTQFGRAELEGTVEAYEQYVRANPDGHHVPEAKRRIEVLEKGSALTEGEQFQDCEGCPWMVIVPAGRATVGRHEGWRKSTWLEGSAHVVVIGKPLAVGMFEVTVEEFGRFVAETKYEATGACRTLRKERADRGWRNPGFVQTEQHPVVCMNWEDASSFVAWLSHKTGKRYRLLSESEWEYAARGGTTSAHYWGDDESSQCLHANGADRSMKRRFGFPDGVNCHDGSFYTAAVGSYTKNGFGLYDMLGNAQEWVEDCWYENYRDGPHDGAPWIDGGDCERRVVRGGSWYDTHWGLSSYSRWSRLRTSRSNLMGFRVARELSP